MVDINSDGLTDLKDVIAGLQAMANLTPDGVSTAADIDKDNKIGMPEVLFIMKQLALEGN